jgi:uncharacterized protein (DUF305 family)
MRRRCMRKVFTLACLSLALAGAMTGCGGSTESPSSDAPFDRAFIDAMVPHHEQAIAMARAAKAAGLSHVVLTDIADAILRTQQAEIESMLDWREEWFGSSELDPRAGDALGLSMDDMGMTEMEPDFASADDVNTAFATMMVAHHEGAVAMAELALDRADHAEIGTLARAIIDAQKAEIEAMRPLAGDDTGMGHG